MFEIENIPDEGSIVFRLVHKDHLNRKTRIPSERMFSPDADGLSVDWEKYTTPEQSLIRVGLTYKKNTTIFKDPTAYLIFKLNVVQIRALRADLDVMHTPQYHGNPSPIGTPNNRSHSSIIGYTNEDEEIRVKLRDLAEQVLAIQYHLVTAEVGKLRLG